MADTSRVETRPLQQLLANRPITASSPRLRSEAVVQAAGALVWRMRKGRLELLVVHRPRYDDWSWPKGKLDPGESASAAAVREVAEETGVDVVLGVPLPSLKYRLDGRLKRVHYWSARQFRPSEAGLLAARPHASPADATEIDDVAWLAADRVVDRLSHPSDLGPLDALLALHAAGRLNTRSIVFVRHGRARRRSAWRGPEATRPLTPGGVAQAENLIGMLAAFGIRSVVSSPWERCVATVTPYANAIGVAVQHAPALTEAAFAQNPDAAVKRVRAAFAADRATVTSIHRPVVPAVLRAAAEFTGRSTLGNLPAKTDLRTGELLVAQVAKVGKKPQIVTLERMRVAETT